MSDSTPDKNCTQTTAYSLDNLVAILVLDRKIDGAQAKFLTRIARFLEDQHYADIEHEHLGCPVAKTGIYAPSARKESDGVDWRMRAERAVASLRSFDGPLADYIVKISTTDGGGA